MPTVLDRTVPTLIFKIGSYPLHHGTLGIIRSLGSAGIRVYAIVEDRFTPAAMSRYLADSFLWKTGGLEEDVLLAGLNSIGERLGRPAVLISTDDRAAVFVAEHSAQLEKRFLFPKVSPDLPHRLANKRHLHSLCRSIGVQTPEVTSPNSLDDVYTFIERGRFPVIVKAADSHRLRVGARCPAIAHSPKELLAIYRQAENPESPNLIFQEYIPPEYAEDWIIHGYRNPKTGCLISFTGRKLRSYPPFKGITTLGIPVRNVRLARHAAKLFEAIDYAGIMDLDYRLDTRDGKYKLLDFNPRAGANFRMFENSEGIDVVRALHLDLTGRTVPKSSVRNRKFLVEPQDLLASLGYMRHGGLSIGAWWHSLDGKDKEFAWFRRQDPWPGLMMSLRLVFRLAGRALRAGCVAVRAHSSRRNDSGGTPDRSSLAHRTRRPIPGAAQISHDACSSRK